MKLSTQSNIMFYTMIATTVLNVFVAFHTDHPYIGLLYVLACFGLYKLSK